MFKNESHTEKESYRMLLIVRVKIPKTALIWVKQFKNESHTEKESYRMLLIVQIEKLPFLGQNPY